MSSVTARIYCTISAPLSGAMEDCSIVRVQQLQMLYHLRCCMSMSKLSVSYYSSYQLVNGGVLTSCSTHYGHFRDDLPS